MNATTEEHKLEVQLGEPISMGVNPRDLEIAENTPMWEAMQHEVLMRNMEGFYA